MSKPIFGSLVGNKLSDKNTVYGIVTEVLEITQNNETFFIALLDSGKAMRMTTVSKLLHAKKQRLRKVGDQFTVYAWTDDYEVSKQKFGPAKPSAKRIAAGKEDAAKRLSTRTQQSARDLLKRRKPSIIGRGITKFAPPVAKAATKVKESKFGKTTSAVNASKPAKITKAGIAATTAATGVAALAVGGTKPAANTKTKTTYQAGAGLGRLSRLTARKAQAERAEAAVKAPPKKFGAAGESKFLKGRSAVRQSVIDQINKQGMAKSLAAVQSHKNDPEYLEAIRRYYGAKRLKKALKG